MSSDIQHSHETQNSGSPMPGEPEFLAVGKLLRPHGVRGEMRFAVWTDFPERLKAGVVVFVGQAHQPVHIKEMRGHLSNPIIAFDEFQDRDAVATLRNQVIYIRTSDLPPLPDGEVYLHQLIGLQVIRNEDDLVLGRVAEILETGANDVFLVRRTTGADLLIPDIDTVVLDVNLSRGEIRVHLLPGLLPEP